MELKTRHWTDYEKDTVVSVRAETRRQSVPLTELSWEHTCLTTSGHLWSDPQMTTKVLWVLSFLDYKQNCKE